MFPPTPEHVALIVGVTACLFIGSWNWSGRYLDQRKIENTRRTQLLETANSDRPLRERHPLVSDPLSRRAIAGRVDPITRETITVYEERQRQPRPVASSIPSGGPYRNPNCSCVECDRQRLRYVDSGQADKIVLWGGDVVRKIIPPQPPGGGEWHDWGTSKKVCG